MHSCRFHFFHKLYTSSETDSGEQKTPTANSAFSLFHWSALVSALILAFCWLDEISSTLHWKVLELIRRWHFCGFTCFWEISVVKTWCHYDGGERFGFFSLHRKRDPFSSQCWKNNHSALRVRTSPNIIPMFYCLPVAVEGSRPSCIWRRKRLPHFPGLREWKTSKRGCFFFTENDFVGWIYWCECVPDCPKIVPEVIHEVLRFPSTSVSLREKFKRFSKFNENTHNGVSQNEMLGRPVFLTAFSWLEMVASSIIRSLECDSTKFRFMGLVKSIASSGCKFRDFNFEMILLYLTIQSAVFKIEPKIVEIGTRCSNDSE